jgi:hypothetical protein
VFQYLDPDGSVAISALLAPADPLPAMPAPVDPTKAESPSTVAGAAPTDRSAGTDDPVDAGPPRARWVGLGAGAAATLLLFGAAALVHDEHTRASATGATGDTLDSLQFTYTGLLVGGTIAGGLTVVAGIGLIGVEW